MKFIPSFIFLALPWFVNAQNSGTLGAGNSNELIEKGLKRLAIEKGMILYKVEDQPNDTLIVVFDRFGWREATMEFGEKKYYGMKTNINTKAVIDGEAYFTMNLKDKTGKLIIDTDLVKLAGYKNPEELFVARMSQMKATKIGLETILDKECDVWQYTSRGKTCKLWSWKGLELKHYTASNKKVAIKLNLDPSIEEAVFSIPKDINWKSPENN